MDLPRADIRVKTPEKNNEGPGPKEPALPIRCGYLTGLTTVMSSPSSV